MSIVADERVLVQSAVLAAEEHGKTKEPLPPRPRGPHPYRVAGGASRLEGALAEQRHRLDDPALEAAFARLAPSIEGRWAA